MNVDVHFEDFATPHIEELAKKCAPIRLCAVVRSPCVQIWKRRLASLPPNRQGYKSTRFWEKCTESVQGTSDGNRVVLEAGGDKDTMGLRQRYYGGPVPISGPRGGPKGVMLAIPIHADSYGKVPADFGDSLDVTFRRVNGELRCYLVQNTYVQGKRGGQVPSSSKFLFRLKGQVFQEANPRVVPTEDEFAEVCLGAIERHLA